MDSAECRGGLRDLHAGILQAAKLAFREIVEAAEASAKATTLFQDRSTDTRKSIHHEILGNSGLVEAGGAARLLEGGTVAHRIEAHGTALRFVMNGEVMFRRFVDHPGTEPRPFMQEAASLAEFMAPHTMEYFLNYAIERA